MLTKLKELVQSWVDKQGHNKCWYYPEIFEQIADILEVKPTKPEHLPLPSEFHDKCMEYSEELYGPLACDKVRENIQKWQHYEQEYILPVFDIAARNGIDLHKLTRNNPGKNCVVLALEHFENLLKKQNSPDNPIVDRLLGELKNNLAE